MAIRFKKKGPLARTYLKQWREFRELSQDDLADMIGTSGASVSRVENLETPYTQDWLEAVAEALGCAPADLISRDPRDERGPIDQAIKLLEDSRRR
jgi:transcriptional regulator with XRE-family HTH domain